MEVGLRLKAFLAENRAENDRQRKLLAESRAEKDRQRRIIDGGA